MGAFVGRAGGVVAMAAMMITLMASGAQAHDAAGPPAGAVVTQADGAGVIDGEITLAGPPDQPVFSTGEPVRLTFDVTNSSADACGLATEPDGTLRVVSLRRDGEDVAPLLGNSYYSDGVANAIAASMTTVDPGSSIAVRVGSLSLGDTVLLRSVVPTASGGGLDALWPVSGAGRYELTVAYAVPPVDAATARCTGAAATTVTFTVGGVAAGAVGVPWWVVAVVVAVVIGVVVAVVMFVRRRGRAPRGAGPAAAGIMLLLGVAVAVVTPGRPAQASYVIDPDGGIPVRDVDFRAAVEDCLARFRSPGGDPAGLLPRLEDPTTPQVTIIPVEGDSRTWSTPASPQGPGSSVITWDPISTDPYGDGVPRDPCAALYHELVHADGFSTGTTAAGGCTIPGLSREEARATLIENTYRYLQGLRLRTEHGGHRLPDSLADCAEPLDPVVPRDESVAYCEDDAVCGRTSGDPHLVTFDRHYYDFQAVGEFVLVRATSGPPLQVQVRQAPFGRYRTVSVNSAVAMQVADRTIALLLVDGVSRVFLDGEAAVLPAGETPLSGGAWVVRRVSDIGVADGYDVVWPDGSAVRVDHDGYGYRVLVRLDDSRAGAVAGLLGNFDGDPTNDLVSASGEPLDLPVAFTDLYPSYADSWRVTAETSLFPYADGESTETFTDRDYPAAPASVADLDEPARAQAEQVCRFAGVTDPWLLAECVLDVGVTGRPEFAVSTAATARTAPPAGAPVVADAVAEGAVAPGSDDRLTFTARAGDVLAVDVVAPALADGCSPIRLLDQAGTVIGRGCLAGGRGFIDRVVIEADGEYSVAIEGRSGDKGRAMVRVYTSRDTDGTIEPNGDAVTAVIGQPGSVARYTFTGTAGQRVFVAATGGTLPNQCSPVRLEDASGARLGQACLAGGRGHIDGTVLPADGTYTVVVDPANQAVGTVTLRLHVSDDAVAPIALDGPAVTATIDTPGAVPQYEFTAAAGTSVTVVASDATLPDGCPPLRLVDATGRTLGSGCLTAGGGTIGPVVLPADGTYRLVVDPIGAATGAVTLAVRSN
jgi:hypothetical protein